jgi:uncharacterized protein (DUF2147 family)
MKMTAFTRLGAAAVLFLFPGSAFADGPAGTWRHPNNALIKFYECGGGMCAQLVKPKVPDERDVNNPDAGKRNQKMQGLVIMDGAKKVSNTEWRGKIYNPEDGGTYNGKGILSSSQELKLEGCALGGLVCNSETLSRVGN